ncbi:MAG: hypothetical protein ABJA80_04985 [bacterium]
MHLRRSLLPLLLTLVSSLAGASCRAATIVVSRDGAIAVTPTAEGLSVVNHSAQPIYLMVIERETTTLADWIPCRGGPTCISQAPGAARLVPWNTVLGYAPNRPEYVVYWWSSAALPDGSLLPGPVERLSVTR